MLACALLLARSLCVVLVVGVEGEGVLVSEEGRDGNAHTQHRRLANSSSHACVGLSSCGCCCCCWAVSVSSRAGALFELGEEPVLAVPCVCV